MKCENCGKEMDQKAELLRKKGYKQWCTQCKVQIRKDRLEFSKIRDENNRKIESGEILDEIDNMEFDL